MKKIVIKILFFIPIIANACTEYVIGFRGNNEVFDNSAFVEFATKQNKCYKSFAHHKINDAIKFIKFINKPYQLYGYSRGAQSIITLLKHNNIKPTFIITVGAYYSVDVNFDRYNIPYQNYFDRSGIGQKSLGIFLDVNHNEIQKEVNKVFFNLKEK